METVNFKTNIKCSGCVAQVTPELNKVIGEGNWQVDVSSPDKLLKVNNGSAIPGILEAVRRARFKAEQII